MTMTCECRPLNQTKRVWLTSHQCATEQKPSQTSANVRNPPLQTPCVGSTPKMSSTPIQEAKACWKSADSFESQVMPRRTAMWCNVISVVINCYDELFWCYIMLWWVIHMILERGWFKPLTLLAADAKRVHCKQYNCSTSVPICDEWNEWIEQK